jgi:hypothetical protein
MTGGAALSVRERERQPRARARSGPPAGPRGWADRERTGTWAVWLGRTGGKEGKQPGSDFVFVFLFQINE